jgi:aerobic carbon-monoxide dehydrogenase medium subunit
VTFEIVEPASLADAIAALDPDDSAVRPIAGGTAVSLLLQSRLFQPRRLVSLRRLDGALRGVHVDEAGGLRIGALATLSELERSPLIAISAGVVAQALHRLSNVRVRNVATVGGHLAHGDPHQDLPPILLTLGARVRAVGPHGERWIEMADLITGYYETSLRPQELIVELYLPPQPAGVRAVYEKFTALSAEDWPSVGVAAWLRRDGDTIVETRIGIGSATDRPVRVAAAEALVTAGGAAAFADAADACAAAIDPVPDLRGSVPYKREMVRVHVGRALARASEVRA